MQLYCVSMRHQSKTRYLAGILRNPWADIVIIAFAMTLLISQVLADTRSYPQRFQETLPAEREALDMHPTIDAYLGLVNSLHNVEDFPINARFSEMLLRYVERGGLLIVDYHTKLRPSKHSDLWKYHSREEFRKHFGYFTNARTTFSLRVDTLLLGSWALREPFVSMGTLASQLTGVGGELLAVVQRK